MVLNFVAYTWTDQTKALCLDWRIIFLKHCNFVLFPAFFLPRIFMCSPGEMVCVAAGSSWNTARKAWSGGGHCAWEIDTGGCPETRWRTGLYEGTSVWHCHLSPRDFFPILGVIQCGQLFMLTAKAVTLWWGSLCAYRAWRWGGWWTDPTSAYNASSNLRQNSQCFSSGGMHR